MIESNYTLITKVPRICHIGGQEPYNYSVIRPEMAHGFFYGNPISLQDLAMWQFINLFIAWLFMLSITIALLITIDKGFKDSRREKSRKEAEILMIDGEVGYDDTE
jgi:hypothetical protein